VITYVHNNYPEILSDLVEHLWLALVPIVVGAVLSLPLGYLAARRRSLYQPVVSVGALVGSGGLGNLFTGGFQLGFVEPIIIGIVLSMLLAGLFDVGLVLLQRQLTPWTRAGGRA
jgi:ABC-type proline/glycine betaine transport system permease subunit